MTKVEQLAALYETKRANGLVDVRFNFDIDRIRETRPSAEILAGEILACEAAIAAGRARPLVFGVKTLSSAQERLIAEDIAARREIDPDWPRPNSEQLRAISVVLNECRERHA